MPPCGDLQQDVVVDAAFLLREWSGAHPEFVVGASEAGMILGGETRAADVAIWRKADLGPHTGGYRRVAPVLAVEIAGQDEGETELAEKARWNLEHGVTAVWIVLPELREVIAITTTGETRPPDGRASSVPFPGFQGSSRRSGSSSPSSSRAASRRYTRSVGLSTPIQEAMRLPARARGGAAGADPAHRRLRVGRPR